MLKRIILTALLIALPLSATMIYAEDVEPPSSIESAQNIVVDDEYDATTEIIEEVEVVEEQTTEQIEEVVVEEVIEEVEETQEQEQEVVEEITEEEVTEEETTEEDKLELQPAPMMTMAAPRMLGALGKSTDPTAQTDTYPIYLNIKLSEYIRGKYTKNVSYNFENNHWVAIIDNNLTTECCVTGYQLDIDNTGSVNNVYVECTYTPLVDGTYAKFYQKDKSGEEPRREYASSRYASTCVKMKTNWIRYAMYGYGRQERTTGAWAASMLTNDDDKKQICKYRGYIAVNAENADMSQIKEEGGIYGTFSFVVNLSREGFANFSEPSS